MTHQEFANKYLRGEINGLFLRNIVMQKGPEELHRKKGLKTINAHIWYAFNWARSPQGHKYWSVVANNIQHNPFYYNRAAEVSPIVRGHMHVPTVQCPPPAPEQRSWEVWGVYDKCEHRDAQVPMILCQTRHSARKERVNPVNGKYCEGVRKYIVTEA